MIHDNNFSIEEIHRIRRENYEKTKDMTPSEIIAETNRKAAVVEKMIQQIRAAGKN